MNEVNKGVLVVGVRVGRLFSSFKPVAEVLNGHARGFRGFV